MDDVRPFVVDHLFDSVCKSTLDYDVTDEVRGALDRFWKADGDDVGVAEIESIVIGMSSSHDGYRVDLRMAGETRHDCPRTEFRPADVAERIGDTNDSHQSSLPAMTQ